MDKRLIEMLDSPDVSERERAIKAIARTGNPDYIQYLNVVVRTDADPALRTLAEKAIRYIRQQQGSQAPSTPDVAHATQEVARTTPERVEVSPANERRAATMLDRAMELSTRHRDEEARELVAKAYRLDPNIRFDSYKRGIVANVMGVSASEAFDSLDRRYPDEDVKAKRKAKNDDQPAETIGWGSALLDLAIYGVVIVVSIIVGYFLILQFAGPILRDIVMSMGQSGELGDDFNPEMIVSTILSMGAGLAIAYALALGVISIVMTFFMSVCLHLAAKLIGGVGTLPRLINKTVPLLTGYYVFSYIAGIVVVALIVYQIGTAANTSVTFDDGTMMSVTFDESIFEPLDATMSVVNLLGGIVGVIFFIVYVGRVAAAYEFSWLRGCFAYFLGNIFLAIVSCACIMVLPILLGPAISGVFNTLTLTMAAS